MEAGDRVRRVAPRRIRRRREAGATLLLLLLGLAIAAVPLAVAMASWSVEARREREAEFQFRGEAYRRAIQSYRRAPPHDYPASYADLLDDRRGPRPVRHLRQLYPDPWTGAPTFEPIRDGAGHIVAVHSTSDRHPLAVEAKVERYSDIAFGDKPAEGSP
jgi:type II secretory pathway pseudopilin PulG